jgi:DNA-binding IclR family transcriptional regulator
MTGEPENELSVSGVASVDRALSVLTAFRRGDGALSLAELTRRTGLVKSTVMRLAISLEHFGLLRRVADGQYRLDTEVLRLASVYQEQIDLEGLVIPILRRLVDQTKETASFYIRHGDYRMCLFRVDSPHQLRLHIRPGDILPMDESSIAQVLRAFDSPTDQAKLPAVPLYTAGKRDPHTAGLSIPVFGAEAKLMGALAISGPITRFTAERAQAVSWTFRELAEELTRTLGGEGMGLSQSDDRA